jgi:hypothetical protein
MGIFSWFKSRGPVDIASPSHSLAEHRERERAKTEEMKRAAAADIAAVEEDDKYFSPGDPEDDL